MSRKTLTYGGMLIGSAIGGFLPGLWTTTLSPFSFAGVIGSAIGALIGIYVGFKMGS